MERLKSSERLRLGIGRRCPSLTFSKAQQRSSPPYRSGSLCRSGSIEAPLGKQQRKEASRRVQAVCGNPDLLIHALFPLVRTPVGRLWLREWLSLADLSAVLQTFNGKLVLVCGDLEQSRAESHAAIWGWSAELDSDRVVIVGDKDGSYLSALQKGTTSAVNRLSSSRHSKYAGASEPSAFAVWQGCIISEWRQAGLSANPNIELERGDPRSFWRAVRDHVLSVDERGLSNSETAKNENLSSTGRQKSLTGRTRSGSHRAEFDSQDQLQNLADGSLSLGGRSRSSRKIEKKRANDHCVTPSPGLPVDEKDPTDFIDRSFDISNVTTESHQGLSARAMSWKSLGARTESWRSMSSCEFDDDVMAVSPASMGPRSMSKSRPLHSITDLRVVKEDEDDE